MKIEIVARETIKPSSPTPQSLRYHKLCLLDQFIAPIYGTLLFCYSSNGYSNHHVSVSQISKKLKKSFSDMLTLFHPFAGRTIDNIMIDCNDNGAIFIEARVDCSLSHFLQQPDGDEIRRLIPALGESMETSTGFLSLVQANFFDCGGVAIGVSIMHKLADAATVATFMRCWAAVTTLGSADVPVVPVYNGAAIFPPTKLRKATKPPALNWPVEQLPKRRLVFDASKMDALRAAAASKSVERPSRAEAVTALIWRCALKAARTNSGFPRRSVLTRIVNIRGRVVPPLPENSVGNLIGHCTARKDERETELKGLVRELRERMQVFDKNFVKMVQKEDGFGAVADYFKEALTHVMSPEVENYGCTSLCNFPVYDINFGWGKPAWVTTPCLNRKNEIMMIDGRKGDGSIEAWVVLSKEDMNLFERDPELLAFASLDPPVLDLDTQTVSLRIKSSL